MRLIIKSMLCSLSSPTYRDPTEQEAEATYQAYVAEMDAAEAEAIAKEENPLAARRRVKRPDPRVMLRDKVTFTKAQIESATITKSGLKVGTKTYPLEGHAVIHKARADEKARVKAELDAFLALPEEEQEAILLAKYEAEEAARQLELQNQLNEELP
jgi:hypothetical protein